MSVLLADIDATCAALGYFDGDKYHAEPDAIQGLKHLIWILRRDIDNHEYRRHLGRAKVLQTDLVPMLPHYIENEDYCDVLIRLLVVLTNPTLLLYRNGLPKDGPGRKIYLELVDILQGYKEAFTSDYCWATLTTKLHKVLGVDWAVRGEEEGLLIERILVLVRNVLQVPANPEAECRADNDASLHDQVIWALHQSGMLDLVLYILSSANENQYHLHALEIVCLMYREQSAPSLSDASLQRSAAEKHRDEQELVAVRRREKQKLIARPPPGRHSRFGGTYVLQNVKSVSDKDIICHQSLERAMAVDFDREKVKQKRSHRFVKEENAFERRSAFSVRLCLREYCIEVLRSAYNTLVRQVRRVLERNSGSASHDDSYLLWAIRFFMEFNRLSGLQLHLVSESLSVQCFHWVLTRIQNAMDMITCDKTQSRLWARRLHVTVQTFRELLLSLLALKTLRDEKAQALFDMLLNNVCYVLEYRETILHLLMNYNESHSTKAYLRDVVEMANIFIKMMEKFCQDSVVVQDKRRQRKKTTKSRNKQMNAENENLEDIWAVLASEVSSVLTKDITLSEEEHPVPFDAAAEKSIDDQKEDCMLRIHKFLREEKIEHAIILMRSAREVWPENDCFGAISSAPEDELMLLREIFLSNLGSVEKPAKEAQDNDGNDDHEDDEDEDDEEEEPELVEKDFRFEDFAKRLINPRIVRACTVVLSDWEKIPTKSLKSAVTILYRIAFGCKCPAMLYQATLFKIFQQVFNAPKDPHHEELRRLGVYVVRKFVEIAPTNPKIYAELLFYKTLREANDLETGYDTPSGVVKGSWTEEQENELRLLFEENQRNPETDEDVIDWILDNLIDKTRTRRGVLKKLKELGLVFKKPTKKSTAAAANKSLWQNEDDDRLRNLYDEHRLQEDCLDRIMEAIGGNWSKNQVIKRMIQIHLIADRSEILPKKGKKRQSKKSQVRSTSLDDDDDDMQDVDRQLNTRKAPSLTRKKQTKKLVKTPLDVKVVKSLLNKIDEKFQAVIDWLKNSLTEAAEDFEEPSDDPEDGVPLLPLQDIEREAIDDVQFKKLLISMGIQPPISEMENYWRIPVYLTAADLQMRLDVLNGTYEEPAKIAENEDSDEQNNEDEVEIEENNEMSYEDYMQEKRRQRLESLVFNKSDDDDEHRTPLKQKLKNKNMAKKTKNSKEKSQKEKVGKLNIRDMIKDAESDDKLSILDVDSEQGLRQRLAELSESDNSEKENDSADPSILARKRIRTNIIDSDSSDDETEVSQTKTNPSRTDNAEVNFNQELTGLVDQSINLIESTADVGNADIQPLLETNGKRTRSEDDDDMSDEGIQVKRRKSKDSTARRRKVAIIEDDDD